mgnify:CR=1 FL=1
METKDKVFTVRDVPGHPKLARKVTTALNVTDVGLLVVSIEDEIDLKQKKQDEITESILLAKGMDVPQLIVCINKMDKVNFD